MTQQPFSTRLQYISGSTMYYFMNNLVFTVLFHSQKPNVFPIHTILRIIRGRTVASQIQGLSSTNIYLLEAPCENPEL